MAGFRQEAQGNRNGFSGRLALEVLKNAMNFKGRKIQTFMICLIHFSTSDRDSRYMWSIDPIVTSNQSCRFRTRRFGFNLQPNRSIERWLHIFKKVAKETHLSQEDRIQRSKFNLSFRKFQF